MMIPSQRLLILDDDDDMRGYFRDIAEAIDFDVREADEPAAFVACYDTFAPNVILLDLTLPGMDGIEVLRELARRGCKARIVLVSGQDGKVLAAAQRFGRMQGLAMAAVLQKPIAPAALETALAPSASGGPSLTAEQLQAAIEQNRFVLHFQPKVDLLADGFRVIACEALARLQLPAGPLLSPGVFVPLAEKTGLIAPLGDLILQNVVNQLQRWRQRGVDLPTSVNISPTQLGDLSLPDRLASMLAEARVPAMLLELEVTEQSVMADVARATDILTRLRLKRLPVSLDDFGAGYSSLVEIYRMPFTELKLDRSLVSDIEYDQRARSVLRAIVALSRELDLTVCAEGVETDVVAHFLREIGCAKAQGFLFGAPMQGEHFLATISSRLGAWRAASPAA
jgi:EAL domain-containing protein (putative c-di-GMP-specific phosphodiesterase class I)